MPYSQLVTKLRQHLVPPTFIILTSDTKIQQLILHDFSQFVDVKISTPSNVSVRIWNARTTSRYARPNARIDDGPDAGSDAYGRRAASRYAANAVSTAAHEPPVHAATVSPDGVTGIPVAGVSIAASDAAANGNADAGTGTAADTTDEWISSYMLRTQPTADDERCADAQKRHERSGYRRKSDYQRHAQPHMGG